ncbi:MAG: ATPase, T2SS/T4P/T4SS family [Patescibacteria group bacterium]
MTRKELARIVAKKVRLTIAQAEDLIVALEETITGALDKSDKVIYSNFGTFYTVHYPSRVITHPKLGKAKKMIMLPTNVAKWMPADNIKQAVKTGRSVEGITLHGTRKKNRQLTKPANTSVVLGQDKNVPAKNNIAIPIIVNHSKDQASLLPPTPKKEKKESSLDKGKSTGAVRAAEKDSERISIYEELMGDGTKEESTFNGVIRVPKKDRQSFWARIFGPAEKEGEESAKKKLEKKEEETIKVEAPPPVKETAKSVENKPKDHPIVPKPEEKGSTIGEGFFDVKSSNPLDTSRAQIPASAPHQQNGPIPAELLPQLPAKQNGEVAGAKNEKDNKNAAKIETETKPGQSDTTSPVSKTGVPGIEKMLVSSEMGPFPMPKSEISYIDLSKTTVPKEILQLIPEKIARRYKTVPVAREENKLVIAMIDPEDIEAKEIIKKNAQMPLVTKITTESDLSHILDQYQGLESEVEKAIEEVNEEGGEKKEEVTKALMESASDDAPAARIVTSLLRRAIRDKASDIHIEPLEGEVTVRFRVDGVLRKKVALPKDVQLAVVSRIKILSELKIDEQRVPQDGRFSINIDTRRVDFRVSTMPTAYGEKVVMRLLDKSQGILTIEQLGLDGIGLKNLEANLDRSHGMILVTGPTGSGKTTTLYALIDRLFHEGVNIVTLEDPIEYQMPGVNQSQVNPEINYTFASGLRSIVRQDPDIIMIGEIRDGETAEMAVQSALTGHIVLSTLHTNDAAGAAPRLIDMGVEPFLLTSSTNIIIAQRLARRLCDECRQEYKPGDIEMQRVNEIIERMPENEKKLFRDHETKFSKSKGCKVCEDTGYRGRVGLFEVLGITEEIKSLVIQKVSASKIQEAAVENGMVTMIQDGILKASKGLTSLEEIWRVTKD